MGQAKLGYGLVVIGGGPAGLAPLLAAHRTGMFDALAKGGIAVIEQSDELGAGLIGQYAINSDSSGSTFVDCLTGPGDTELTRLRGHPLVRQVAAAGDGAVALRNVGDFLHLVGGALVRMVSAWPGCSVMTGHRALSASLVAGQWEVLVREVATGVEQVVRARSIVIATGAEQPTARLAAAQVAGRTLAEGCAGRLVQSGDVLTRGGLDAVAARLARRTAPRVAIVGGSTSAAAVAHALLNRLPGITFGQAGVALLHRRELRVYYPNAEAAFADKYTEWDTHDLCPLSGRVFRLAGFRLESRELIMQARGIGGRPAEPRLRLLRLGLDDAAAWSVLDQADLVIAAIGYRPKALALLEGGHPIRLRANDIDAAPMVDGQCRVVNRRGAPVPGVFGIGLAAGFVPSGRLGGEPSFRGQANGLWLWQTDVGAMIAAAVLERLPRLRSSQPSPLLEQAGEV